MTGGNLPNPKCKITIGAVTVLDLDTDVKDAFNINVILSILSRGLGGAKFTTQNFDGKYTHSPNLIAEGDDISIKLYRTGAAETEVFGGRITKLTPRSPGSPEHYIDVEAIDKGQALQVPGSLFSAWYSGAGGKAILTAIINSVGLTPDVDPENNIASTHNKSFDEVLHWNALKEMCDAVVMGDGAIGADGFVTPNGYVHVFKRGIHASGVSLTDKIRSYNVDNDWYRIRNKIKIYSKPPKVDPANQPTIIPGHAYPSNYDAWTKVADDANWVEENGTISWMPGGKVGSDYLFLTLSGGAPHTIRRMHDQINCLAKGGFKSVNMWIQCSCPWTIRLLAPNTSNYYELLSGKTATPIWTLYGFWFGPDYEYDVDANPTGTWQATGSPSWTDIEGLQFIITEVPLNIFDVDGLYYGNAPYQAEVSADPGAYGVRCLEPQWVEGLRNDYECQQYGQGLLKYYQNKVRTVNLETFGDNGFVPGYMQHVEIANDAIDESFRILEITHSLRDVDWTTNLVMGDEPIKLDWWVRKMWEKQRLTSQSVGKF